MEIFDSHAHYDDPAFDPDRTELLESFPARGIVGIVNAGASVRSSLAAVSLAARYPFIHAAVGIHPEEAADFQPGDIARIGEIASGGPKVIAIGEIGLDYHCGVDRALQKQVFENQLRLADEHRLPVIIHDREAHADTLELIRKYRPRGVVHCFSGSAEMAGEVIALGMYLGFTGVVTFKNNRKAAGVLAAVPHDRVLVETDCPYMAPEPLRGRRCDSSMLVHTITRIASYWEMQPDDVARQTAGNVRRLFGIR